MTRRVRSAFGRFLALSCAVALTLLVVASSLAAQQTTGKIEGTVTDQQGAPIASAQVTIVGTSFGALTDNKGYYFINNVPVGSYTIRTKFIGYTAAEVPGVRVQGGQTITQNVKLTPSAVAIGPVTVEAAANPIVPRDQVTSKSIISGDLVAKLPVDDVRQVISLTPGVVESGATGGVSIRGGRPGEANVYVDGAPVRGTNNGAQRVVVGTNAIEEASVTTGALGVEFSDAQAGVISYTTRAGGPTYQGSASYETDQPFGDAMSVGFNRIEASFGGPVPNVKNLTFFASTVLQGQLAQLRGKGSDQVPSYVLGGTDQVVTSTDTLGNVTAVALPRYVQYSGQCGQLGSSGSAMAQAIQSNYGFECQGRRRPYDWADTLTIQGKLQYSYGTGSTVALTGLVGGNQNRNWPRLNSFAPSLYNGAHSWTRLAVLNWNHQVSRTAERALAINVNLSWARDRALTGPLTTASEIDSRSPTGGVTFKSLQFAGMDGVPFPLTDEFIRNKRANQGFIVPLLNRSDLANGQPFRLNPWGLSSNDLFTSGLDAAASQLSETRYTGRLVVDWQANRFHRFTLGGDVRKTDLSFWSVNGLEELIFSDMYLVHPVWWSVFGADRLDLGDVVLELGGRYDYYDSRTLFPKVPASISTNPLWNADAATNDTAYTNSLARVFTPSVGHHTISPRLRVSFPITESTDFRLSYSHQVQTPEFTTVLTGINNDISTTNTNDVFARDLNFGKTILFEFGVRHAFTRDVVLDLSAYNKDKVSDYAARILPFVNPRDSTDTTSLNVVTNRDFGNSRGVDVKFDWRAGSYINATAAYTLQFAKSTGSDPFSYLQTFARQVSGLTGDRTPPPEAPQPTNDNRTHNLVAAFALSLPNDYRKGTGLGEALRNVSVFATFRAQSGLPYTLLINNGDGQTAPRLNFGLGGRPVTQQLNTAVMPWTKNLDIRLNKGFRVGRSDWIVFADVRNVLNFKNIVALFAETGDVVNAVHKEKSLTSEFKSLWAEASDAAAFTAKDSTVTLSDCTVWAKPVNCESLRRVEARFGNGDGIYTLSEQQRALNNFYNAFFGVWRFNGLPRQVRLGAEVNF